jgi:hypothetical protein
LTDGYIKIDRRGHASLSETESASPPRRRISFGGFSVPLPQSRVWRVALGIVLILGGALGFLPILGFWMIPLGLLVLSIDLAIVRRQRRRAEVWWGRRNKSKPNGQN